MLVRLHKYMADCGIASRRKAEELIKKGFVRVNGKRISELGTQIDPEKDIVTYEGKQIKNEQEKVCIMLNKPSGYISTAKDQFGRPTVMDLVSDISGRLFPVGRLDYDTSGLILLTNDGELAHMMTHPKHRVDKVYVAYLAGMPTQDEMKKFMRGLKIEDYVTAPADIQILSGGEKTSSVRITIREGRNRQVRKMCEAIGHDVLSLKRVSIGNLSLGNLSEGKYRKLTKKEKEALFLFSSR